VADNTTYKKALLTHAAVTKVLYQVILQIGQGKE